MKLTHLSIALATVAVAFALQAPAHASFGFTNLQISDLGTSNPTGAEISYGGTHNDTGTQNGFGHHTGTNVNPGGHTGNYLGVTQTFTVPGSTGSVELLDIKLMLFDSTGTYTFPTSPALNWQVSIGKVTGSTISGVQSITTFNSLLPATAVGAKNSPPAYTNGDYIQFALGDANYITLDAGSTYFFNIYTSNGGNGGGANITSARNGTNGLEAGLTSLANGSTITTNANAGNSFIYYIDTVAVPEPSSWAILPVLGTLAFLGYRRFKAVPATE